MSNKDEFAPDPWAGKKMGETYEEARQRQMEELGRTMDRQAQEERDREIAKQAEARKTQDSINSASGRATTSPQPFSGAERTAIANFVMKLGWLSLIVGLCLWLWAEKSVTVYGASLHQILVWNGAACLTLVYFHQFVNLIFFGVVCWMFYVSGQTSEGYSFGAVPLRVWVASILLLILSFGIGAAFERRR